MSDSFKGKKDSMQPTTNRPLDKNSVGGKAPNLGSKDANYNKNPGIQQRNTGTNQGGQHNQSPQQKTGWKKDDDSRR